MITKFGSLFAGHVDLDNIGWTGTPVNDRWLSDEHLASVFDKTEAIVLKMEELGYDTFWAAEHHFQREGYECIPNLLLLFVHLAHLTRNLKFGCGFNINPMWHPLRLAEDFATADYLTKGRVVFGVGRGYHSREVETFGNPSTAIDNDANRQLFEEQVEVMMKAFNQRSFSHHGEYYDIPPNVPYRGYDLEEITLVPRPLTLPVECWQPIVSASQRAMDFMVKHGMKGIIGGGAAAGGTTDRVMEQWRDHPGRHRTGDRTGRRFDHRLYHPHRRDAGEGHRGVQGLLRGEHEDVRPPGVRARPHQPADCRPGQPGQGAFRRPAHPGASRGGRFVAGRPAGAYRAADTGRAGTLSRPGVHQRRFRYRRPPRGNRGTVGHLRQGSNAGVH